MIGKPKRIRKHVPQFKATRNPNLAVKWEGDIYVVGIGTMTCSLHGKEYVMRDVPKRVFLELLRRPDPDFYFAQLRTIYKEKF